MKQLYPFLFLLILVACKERKTITDEPSESTEQIQAVKVEDLKLTTESIPIDAVGAIKEKEEVMLSFKTGGIIERIHAKELDYVSKGKLLASVNTSEIDAKVKKAKTGIAKAERDLVRIKNMFEDSIATQEQVDDLTTVVDLAKSDLIIAEYNQEHSKIFAPLSGKILDLFAEQHEIVAPGMPVFRLATRKNGSNMMKVSLADKDVVGVKINDKADVQLDAYPDKTFQARVTLISEEASPLTGTFDVELTIATDKKFPLKIGFIGKTKIYPSPSSPYYKIGMNSLVEGHKDKANIFIVTEKDRQPLATKVTVYPKYIGGDFFTIEEKQFKDQKVSVITDGSANLSHGMKIRIIE